MWWLALKPGCGREKVIIIKIARYCSFFVIDTAGAKIGGGTLMLMAEKYEAQDGHRLHTTNI